MLLFSNAEWLLLEQNCWYPSVTLNASCNTQISNETTAHKHVRSVVPLLLAPLLHLWLGLLHLLLSDAIQVPVYLFPQNTNCLPGTAWSSSTECFPKGFPSPCFFIALLAEVVGQLSDCYSPHYTDSRTQLTSRFHEGESHISKPPHLWRPMTQQTWHGLMLVLIKLFITSV